MATLRERILEQIGSGFGPGDSCWEYWFEQLALWDYPGTFETWCGIRQERFRVGKDLRPEAAVNDISQTVHWVKDEAARHYCSRHRKAGMIARRLHVNGLPYETAMFSDIGKRCDKREKKLKQLDKKTYTAAFYELTKQLPDTLERLKKAATTIIDRPLEHHEKARWA
jgi:hypothetical protein